MSLDLADWIAVASIALPLIAKVFLEWQANAAANHNAALAKILGMAGRQAATAARALATLPAGVSAKSAELALVATARAAIVAEMGDSLAVVKAGDAQVTKIVQGELDKLVVAPIAVLPSVQAALTPVLVPPAGGGPGSSLK